MDFHGLFILEGKFNPEYKIEEICNNTAKKSGKIVKKYAEDPEIKILPTAKISQEGVDEFCLHIKIKTSKLKEINPEIAEEISDEIKYLYFDVLRGAKNIEDWQKTAPMMIHNIKLEINDKLLYSEGDDSSVSAATEVSKDITINYPIGTKLECLRCLENTEIYASEIGTVIFKGTYRYAKVILTESINFIGNINSEISNIDIDDTSELSEYAYESWSIKTKSKKIEKEFKQILEDGDDVYDFLEKYGFENSDGYYAIKPFETYTYKVL
jgi:hypothetical protein